MVSSINLNQYLCYKQLTIDRSNDTFFSERHSTKEGTWGQATLTAGQLEMLFLNIDGEVLRSVSLEPGDSVIIPPAAWHKIKPLSEDFSIELKFYCKPHRYFSKKYNLGEVHSDVLNFKFNYLDHDTDQKSLNVLDVGCGRGRNALYFSKLNHQVTAVDLKESSLEVLGGVAKKEGLDTITLQKIDLNEEVRNIKGEYDVILATVSLQFLEPENIATVLTHLQSITQPSGLHHLVFPIQDNTFDLPVTFRYLATSKALYEFYQNSGWSVLEYKESDGTLGKTDERGRPIQGMFANLIAKKIN